MCFFKCAQKVLWYAGSMCFFKCAQKVLWQG